MKWGESESGLQFAAKRIKANSHKTRRKKTGC